MLEASLVGVFLAFCAIMAGVLWFCLRARRRSSAATQSAREAAMEDRRVLHTLLISIAAGAALALLAAYLIFIRDWS